MQYAKSTSSTVFIFLNFPVFIHLFQVLEMIAPPYSPDFVSLMLPIVQSKEITDTLRTSNGDDDVSQFLSMIWTSLI